MSLENTKETDVTKLACILSTEHHECLLKTGHHHYLDQGRQFLSGQHQVASPDGVGKIHIIHFLGNIQYTAQKYRIVNKLRLVTIRSNIQTLFYIDLKCDEANRVDFVHHATATTNRIDPKAMDKNPWDFERSGLYSS